MGSIREIKSDIQIIEVKREDLSGKFSEADVAQGVLNIIKNKHHHADGSPVQLQVVHQQPSLDDAAFRQFTQREPKRSADAQPNRSPLESLASQGGGTWDRTSTPGGTAAPKSAYTSGGGAAAGGNAYASGSGVAGFNIQCNCGMEFTGTSGVHKDELMVTGSKYQQNDNSSTTSYSSAADEDWGAGMYETGMESDDAYQSGSGGAYRGH